MSYVLPMVLHLLRSRADITQAALALEVGVSPSAVTQAENSDNAMQERVFARYAQALGLTEADALEDGLKLLRQVEAGATLADLFPHLAKPSDAPPPVKPARPSKVHARPPVKRAPAKPARASKIATKKTRARPLAKKGSAPRRGSRA